MLQLKPPVLGTAQLGLEYGVANRTGKPDQRAATEIVQQAWQLGVREFDTAQAYGESERVLGESLSEIGVNADARVITKPHPDLNHLDAGALRQTLQQSLEKLNVPSLYGCMFHREETLSLWDQGLGKTAHELVSSGLTKHIGLSVYSPEKALQALHTDGINMVQVPSNILDRRFEKLGIFDIALEKKKTIFIRSAFLQGLIFMSPSELSPKMKFASEVVGQIEKLTEEYELSPQEIALGYLKSEAPDAKIIFGAETPQQVTECFEAWMNEFPEILVSRIKSLFANVGERILNPVMWS